MRVLLYAIPNKDLANSCYLMMSTMRVISKETDFMVRVNS
jgi:hypothetical protein